MKYISLESQSTVSLLLAWIMHCRFICINTNIKTKLLSEPKPFKQQNECGGHKTVQNNMILEIQAEMPFHVR